MAELRREWVCAGCSMRVYTACHDPIPEPQGWESELCFNCLADIDEPEDHARRLLRAGRKVRTVEGLCPKVREAVAGIRKELVAAGELKATQYEKQGEKPSEPDATDEADEPPTPKKRKRTVAFDPAREPALEMIREDPSVGNREVAAHLGVPHKRIWRWRAAAGLPMSQDVRYERLKQLVVDHPELSAAEVRDQLPYPLSIPTIKKAQAEVAASEPTALT